MPLFRRKHRLVWRRRWWRQEARLSDVTATQRPTTPAVSRARILPSPRAATPHQRTPIGRTLISPVARDFPFPSLPLSTVCTSPSDQLVGHAALPRCLGLRHARRQPRGFCIRCFNESRQRRSVCVCARVQ